jgi:hypothetical protein
MPNHTVTKTVQPNSSLKSVYPPALLTIAAIERLQSASLSGPRRDLHGLVGHAVVCCSLGYNAIREAATNSPSPAHPASVYMAPWWWEVLA